MPPSGDPLPVQLKSFSGQQVGRDRVAAERVEYQHVELCTFHPFQHQPTVTKVVFDGRLAVSQERKVRVGDVR